MKATGSRMGQSGNCTCREWTTDAGSANRETLLVVIVNRSRIGKWKHESRYVGKWKHESRYVGRHLSLLQAILKMVFGLPQACLAAQVDASCIKTPPRIETLSLMGLYLHRTPQYNARIHVSLSLFIFPSLSPKAPRRTGCAGSSPRTRTPPPARGTAPGAGARGRTPRRGRRRARRETPPRAAQQRNKGVAFSISMQTTFRRDVIGEAGGWREDVEVRSATWSVQRIPTLRARTARRPNRVLPDRRKLHGRCNARHFRWTGLPSRETGERTGPRPSKCTRSSDGRAFSWLIPINETGGGRGFPRVEMRRGLCSAFQLCGRGRRGGPIACCRIKGKPRPLGIC